MKKEPRRRFDGCPLLSLSILSRDGVLVRVKDKPLKDIEDLEELFNAIKQKL